MEEGASFEMEDNAEVKIGKLAEVSFEEGCKVELEDNADLVIGEEAEFGD